MNRRALYMAAALVLAGVTGHAFGIELQPPRTNLQRTALEKGYQVGQTVMVYYQRRRMKARVESVGFIHFKNSPSRMAYEVTLESGERRQFREGDVQRQ